MKSNKTPKHLVKSNFAIKDPEMIHVSNEIVCITSSKAVYNLNQEKKRRATERIGLTNTDTLLNIILAHDKTNEFDMEYRKSVNDKSRDVPGILRRMKLVPNFRWNYS